MVHRLVWFSTAIRHPAWSLPRPVIATSSLLATRRWLLQHRELLWICAILLIAALAHGINMFQLPYFENDEGTYMSQAWSVLNQGQLAPYTYWYDHAPLGWIQISLWTLVTGGIASFGPTVYSGRVLMLVMQVGSTFMLYCIARRVTGSSLAAGTVALIFSLSAFGIYFHRRVLLDNISTFWMLLSILLLLSPRLSLSKVWLSALALGISVLSKELTVFLLPAMAYLVYHQVHPAQRLFAISGWVAVLWSVLSLYLMMAVLKGELFPPGTAFFEVTHPHTSLLGSLQYQASRGKDGGLLDGHSAFWEWMHVWMRNDPLLVIGGTVSAIVCTLLIRWQRLIGILGLITLSLLAFLARGGEVLGFYVIPILPLFALDIGLILNLCMRATARYAPALFRHWSLPGPRQTWLGSRLGLGVGVALAALAISWIQAGYRSQELAFASNPTQLWTSQQSEAQVQAMLWVKQHIPTSKCIIVDDYMWTDLAGGEGGYPTYSCLHWYWKVDLDPAISGPVFHHRWQAVDYLISTSQMLHDAGLERNALFLLNQALLHSVVIKHFDTGGWPVDVRLVLKPGVQDPRQAKQASLAPGAQGIVPPQRATASARQKSGYIVGGVSDAFARATLRLRNPTIRLLPVKLEHSFGGGVATRHTVHVLPASTTMTGMRVRTS